MDVRLDSAATPGRGATGVDVPEACGDRGMDDEKRVI